MPQCMWLEWRLEVGTCAVRIFATSTVALLLTIGVFQFSFADFGKFSVRYGLDRHVYIGSTFTIVFT